LDHRYFGGLGIVEMFWWELYFRKVPLKFFGLEGFLGGLFKIRLLFQFFLFIKFFFFSGVFGKVGGYS